MRAMASMPKHPKRPRDLAQLAKMIVDIATGDASEPTRRRRAGEIAAGRPIAIPGYSNFTPTVSDGLYQRTSFRLVKSVMRRKPKAMRAVVAAPISPFTLKAPSGATTMPKRKR